MMKSLRNIKPDMISGGLILSFSLFLIFYSKDLGADARRIPLITAFLIMIFSIIIMIRSFRSKDKDSFSSFRKYMDKPLIFIILLTLVYVYALPFIGFEIASFIYMLIVMILIERKFLWSRVLISGIITLSLIFIFYFGLNLRIPLLFTELFNS